MIGMLRERHLFGIRGLLGFVCWLGIGTLLFAEEPPLPADGTATQVVDPLDELVDRAIEINSKRYLTVGVHTPWQILHGVLAFRQDFLVKYNGEKIRALDWLAHGATYRGTPLFEATEYGGRAQPYTEPYAFEGHANQFLAILTMSRLPMDFSIRTASGQTITIGDMVRHAQMEVDGEDEVTWTLWALAHYLDPDARWTNKYGQRWSIEELVRLQTYAPLREAACGGTHALFALSYARNAYLQTKRRPLRGVWLEADQKIRQYIEAARSLQNPDGSFSSEYFDGPGYSEDFATRLASSGHMLEWLMVALPQQRLKEQWVRRGIAAIARDLIEHRKEPVDCGPLYHAVDALVIYRERTRPQPLPQTDNNSRAGKTNTAGGTGESGKSSTQTDDEPPVAVPAPQVP